MAGLAPNAALSVLSNVFVDGTPSSTEPPAPTSTVSLGFFEAVSTVVLRGIAVVRFGLEDARFQVGEKQRAGAIRIVPRQILIDPGDLDGACDRAKHDTLTTQEPQRSWCTHKDACERAAYNPSLALAGFFHLSLRRL